MGPAAVVDLPDAGVGFVLSFPDRRDQGRDRLAAVVGESAAAVRGREEQQRFTECVELELVVDPVAGPHRCAGVSGQGNVSLVRDRSAGDGVGRAQVWSVCQDPFGHEPDRTIEEGVVADGGGRLPGVALVADPGVAVVVVAALVGALGQRGGGGGDHGAGAAGQAAQHGVGVPGLAGGHRGAQVWHAVAPGPLGAAPQLVRVRQLAG